MTENADQWWDFDLPASNQDEPQKNSRWNFANTDCVEGRYPGWIGRHKQD